ncbi:MAG TPA: TIGR00730 family Rossman fold protein, partial [Fluviicola sp.]|nr:TIGR00730 family Rossman fold protein [Fluviicola sp.]
WVKTSMLEKEGNISPDDMVYLTTVDTADEAVKYIEDFYKTHDLSPNF